jgi:putative glycosyltransferase
MVRDRCDVVYGVQTRRKGGAFERWSGKWFFRVFNFLAGVRLPENATTARLMTRRFVDALLRHEEREVFIDGLWHITGFDQRPQDVVKLGRPETSYTLRRRVALAVNAVTSFSNVPLILIFHLGLAISLLAVAYIVYLVINRFGFAVPLTGWTSVMASIWLLGGLIIVFIGVVGIYLSKLFAEVKRRPYAIIRAIYERKRN